jgi:hypothetical protein
MTPKETAEDIIQKFKDNLKWHTYDLSTVEELSKFNKVKLFKCCITSVEELINESRYLGNVDRFKFWREVKKEIEKLNN